MSLKSKIYAVFVFNLENFIRYGPPPPPHSGNARKKTFFFWEVFHNPQNHTPAIINSADLPVLQGL